MEKKQRVLIKLSGEFLAGDSSSGLDAKVLQRLTDEISQLVRNGIQVALVVGGGNFFRGIKGLESGINRVDGDYMGMLATVMNALALKDFFHKQGQAARVMSALKTEKITEPLYAPKAVEYLRNGEIVIFAGGTGNPYFTTDTAGVLRALEIEADLMLKATRVDGVYDADPEKNPRARKFDKLGFDEALAMNLKIMDATAFALAKDNGLRIVVFNVRRPGAIFDIVIENKNIGTLIQ